MTKVRSLSLVRALIFAAVASAMLAASPVFAQSVGGNAGGAVGGQAQGSTPTATQLQGPTGTGVNSSIDIRANLEKWYNWAIPIGFSLAFLMTIAAGYVYITSMGNKDAVKLAKDMVLTTFLGVAILLLIPIILQELGLNESTEFLGGKTTQVTQNSTVKSVSSVTVYTLQGCGACIKVKEHLKSLGVTYAEIDVTNDDTKAAEAKALVGQEGFPVTNVVYADGTNTAVFGLDREKITKATETNSPNESSAAPASSGAKPQQTSSSIPQGAMSEAGATGSVSQEEQGFWAGVKSWIGGWFK